MSERENLPSFLNSQFAILNTAPSSARRLLLIRHARTVVQPALDPAGWPLDDDALLVVSELASWLRAYHLSALITSSEPKAVATGKALGDLLSLEARVGPGLHEHERSAADYVADAAAFEQRLDRLFRRPDERVWGRETAHQAGSRFAAAVDAVLRDNPHGDVAIVTHGTVISLFVAQHTAVDGLSFWRGLGMPACVVLALPSFGLERVMTFSE